MTVPLGDCLPAPYIMCDTGRMADTITFRPDEDAARALAVLTRDGTTVSSAVRAALIDAARERARSRFALRLRRSPQTSRTAQKRHRYYGTWRVCVRGEVYWLRAPRDARGHEQRSPRYAIVVQSDQFPLSTWLVAPTSTSARPASFRPEVEINGRTTRVLAEQTAAVDPGRLGDSIGHLTFDELRQVEAALRLVLDL